MAKRLCANDFFTPLRDYFFLSCRLNASELPNLHCHEYYEIEIITDGAARDEINGAPYFLDSGDFILLRPDDVHGIRAKDEQGASLVNLAVSASFMEEVFSFLETEKDFPDRPITGRLPQKLLREFSDQMQIFSAIPDRSVGKRAQVKEWMVVCLFFHHALRREQDSEALPFWLRQLLQKMKTPEGFTGGVEYLKAHTELSYPHVCRSFQKYLHKTPVEWINEQRLIYSVQLLLHSNQSILDVALECGFFNLSHFNHLFKEFYGVSPTAYRTMYNKEDSMI